MYKLENRVIGFSEQVLQFPAGGQLKEYIFFFFDKDTSLVGTTADTKFL